MNRMKHIPLSKDAIFHLRVGDGLDGPDCWNNAGDCFTFWKRKYALPEKYYDCVIPILKKNDVKRVVLVITSVRYI